MKNNTVVSRYAVAVLATLFALSLRLALRPVLGDGYPIVFFIPAIMIAGWWGGMGPGVVSTALSVVAGAYFFIAPVYTLHIVRTPDQVALAMFAFTGIFLSYLNQTRRRAMSDAADNAAALQDSKAALEVAYAKEKRIAETLQRSLLLSPAQTKFEGLEVEAFYEPALDEALVGGDFFDAFAVADHRVALVVGDVSGKGLKAATHTAEIKFALRTLLREYPHPATALVRLNNVICDGQELDGHNYGTFVALSLAIVDTRTGVAEVSLAGAEPPVLLRKRRELPLVIADPVNNANIMPADDSTHTAHSIEGAGLPLCVESKFDYSVQAVDMDFDDTLLMLTDGITEARKGRAFLGYDGMTALATRAATRPTLYAMGDALLSDAKAYAGGKLQDDACLLLARRVVPV